MARGQRNQRRSELAGPLALLIAAVVAGCGSDPPPDDHGKLPGLAGTTHPALQEEYQRIMEEGGTPELLASQPPPVEENAASVLRGLFSDDSAEYVFGKTIDLFPVGEFQFRDPAALGKAIRLRKKYDSQRQRAREALTRPACDFVIDYTLGFRASKHLGFVKGVRACAHLEAFLAAEHLGDGDLSAALDAVETMFRLAECLAGEKHSHVRLQGALVRMEALAVLQALLDHRELQRAHVDRAYRLIQNQLASWPDDADAWIADRALGMHFYEYVREGRLTELLLQKERERFAREEILETLDDTTLRNADQDELYYLQAMRKIIDHCQRPYHQRLALFESLREEQHQMRASEEFPFVAARMLLPAVQKGQAIQARERANCEAWAIALARATGRPAPPFQVNPLTGDQYRSEEVDGKILVHDMGPDGLTPVVVPVLTQPDSKPQAESSQQTDP